MNIQKAIEIITLDLTCDFEGEGADLEEALQLSIEALKRVEGNRHYPQPTVYPFLPGETEGVSNEHS